MGTVGGVVMYELDDFAPIAAAYPEPERPRRVVEGVTAPEAPEPVEKLRRMLDAIEPTKPYADFIRIVLAVRSQYPDETGYELVDAWSTEAREANGQQTVRRDPGLFFRTEPHSIGFGTLAHYAEEDGYEAPGFTIVDKKPKEVVPVVAQSDDFPPLTLDEMPYYLRKVVELLKPVAGAWEHDWPEMLALTALSALFPNCAFGEDEGADLGLNLWFLGVCPQGIGKGKSGDAVHDLVSALAVELGQDLKTVTRATPEGFARLVAGERVACYSYHEEYMSLLLDFGKEHMKGAKTDLCSLYDGRLVSYQRSKDSVEAKHPYFVKVAMIQPRAFLNGVDRDDLYNGYLSRFLFCLPRARKVKMGYVNRMQRDQLIQEMREPLLERQQIHRAQWRLNHWHTVPPEFAKFIDRHQGYSGEWVSFADAIYDDSPDVTGRHIVRILKIATLLDLLSASPDVRDGVLHVSDNAAALAVRLVERAMVYGAQVAALAGTDSLGRAGAKLLRYLRTEKWQGGMTKGNMNNYVGISYPDLDRLLPALADSGLIEQRKVGKATKYIYAGGNA